MASEGSTRSGEQKCWACDRPLGDTLDLTDGEIDALHEHLMRTEQSAEPYITRHLDSILDKLPENDILTRDPPAELRAQLLIDRQTTDTDNPGGVDDD